MDRETRVAEMEKVLNSQAEALNALTEAVGRVQAGTKDFGRLLRYYSSRIYSRDVDADSKGLFPEDMPRGVLSEDGVYDLLFEYRNAALEMLETAASMLRTTG